MLVAILWIILTSGCGLVGAMTLINEKLTVKQIFATWFGCVAVWGVGMLIIKTLVIKSIL